MSRLLVTQYQGEVEKIIRNLDLEIEKKFGKGYPDENILFEDSQTAVLIQHGQETARVSMGDAEGLDHVLNVFVDYERPEVRDFRAAIAQFKEDIPHILEALRGIIGEQEGENEEFRRRRDGFLGVCRQWRFWILVRGRGRM